ncbi:MAG TPA: aromatic-ring-hydroxylating dioxygenase subunit beta [Novosphingobium sp.]|nr:aromatic-ring-hydroxylating dioxygenase subunit beta [Novosphingobium sp.]
MSAVIEKAPVITLEEAARLIWREAELLDRHQYKPWLKLWTAGGLYIIPADVAAVDYAEVLNIAYDDGPMREMRVKRLLSGFSMSSAPPARTVRTLSRFVEGEAAGAQAIALRAAMIIVEYKYDRTRVLAADVDYRIVREAGELRIDRKVVTFINADDFLHGIGYLL